MRRFKNIEFHRALEDGHRTFTTYFTDCTVYKQPTRTRRMKRIKHATDIQNKKFKNNDENYKLFFSEKYNDTYIIKKNAWIEVVGNKDKSRCAVVFGGNNMNRNDRIQLVKKRKKKNK